MVGTETRDIGKKGGIEVLIFRLLSIRWDGMEWEMSATIWKKIPLLICRGISIGQ